MGTATHTPRPAHLAEMRGEARRLMALWFERLEHAAEHDEPTANVFVMGNCLELLQAFDVHLVFPEILSLQTAVKKVSLEYIKAAEGWGMSTDVCNYVKTDVGMYLMDMKHPSGRIPKPSLAIASNICLVFTKWAEIWERIHHSPAYVLDIPMGRSHGRACTPGERAFETDKAYVLGQLKELVALLEKITGKRFDPQKLAEAQTHTNRALKAWKKILALNRHTPALYDALADGVVFLGMINIWRGTAEGADFMEMALRAFEQEAATQGAGVQEKFRLLFHGVACYPYLSRFQAMFHGWESNFVMSPYLVFACGGYTGEWLFDPSRPLDSLAEMTLRCNNLAHQTMYFTDEYITDHNLLDDYHIDGIVFHAVKSCRTVSTSHANMREFMVSHHDIPCLYLESDHVDPRYFSEAQIKNRVDAFFEALTQRKFYTRS